MAVRLAMEHRALVRAAGHRLSEARRLRVSAGAYPATRIEAGDGTRPDVGGGEDLAVFQPIDAFGKVGASRAAAEAAFVEARADYRQQLLDVQHEALVAYANLASAQGLASAAREQLEVARALAAATRRRIEAGSLPESQEARAALELLRAQQVVTDRDAALLAARARFAAATGIEEKEVPTARTAGLVALPEPSGEPLAERPDLAVLAARLQGAQAEARAAGLELAPDFEIQARRNPWSTDETYGVRLQLTMPLWDHGASRARRQAARSGEAASLAELEDRRAGALGELRAAELEVAAAHASVASYEQIVATAREMLAREQRGYELGVGTLVDVLDARRALGEVLESLVDARYREDLAIEGLLDARGHLVEEPKA